MEILEKHLVPILKQHHLCSRTIYQQNGALPHIHKKISEFLQMNFGGNFLSRCHRNKWPALSPDLTPADFWYWVELKKRVYINGQLKTKKKLSEKTISAAKAITLGSVKLANVSFFKRISHVIKSLCLFFVNKCVKSLFFSVNREF